MDKKFVALISLLFLSALFFLLFALSGLSRNSNPSSPFTRLLRAQEDFTPSADRSLMFAWPTTLQADGNQTTKIEIFARNKEDIPLPAKNVTITTTTGTIKAITNPTDKTGQASFTLSSTTPGEAIISATIDGIPVTSKLIINFQ